MLTVELSVLGRPYLTVGGTQTSIAARPLGLLARLAAAPRHAVAASRLPGDVWPDEAVPAGRLRVTVSRARAAIGRDRLTFADGWYRLADVRIDADDFDVRLTAARSLDGSLDARIDAYDLALSAWHGPAFDGLQHLDWCRPVASRLDELRAQAIDEWADLVLEAGRHEQVVADLEPLLQLDPLREHRCQVVALALYRSGRQADALATIARTRRRLRDELGLHVGGDLAELERKILDHDTSLTRTAPPPRSAAAVRPVDRPDVDARLRASTVLIHAGAYSEAETVLDDAARLAGDDPTGRSGALVEIARAQLAMSGGIGDASACLDNARAVGRELRDGIILAEVALTRLGAGVGSDWSTALVELTEPIPLLPPDAPERVDLLCAAAVVVALTPGEGAAHQLVDEAARVNASARSQRSTAVVQVARSIAVLHDHGRLDDSCADALSALETARRLGDARLIVAAIQPLLQAWYTRGDFDAVDAILDQLDDASRRAMFVFGRVRVELCRSLNALVRGRLDESEQHTAAALRVGTELGSVSVALTTASQQLLLAWERDQTAAVLPLVRHRAAGEPASVWTAIAALFGDVEAAGLLATVADRVPVDGSHALFVALAAEVAAREGDDRLGRWCLDRLDAAGDLAITTGLGTSALGFAHHFAGLAHLACGEAETAIERFERSRVLAAAAGADLWEGHSLVELVTARRLLGRPRDDTAVARLDALARLDAPRLRRRARDVLAVHDDALHDSA